MNRSICVIFNPAARGEKARRWRSALGTLGPGCVLKATSSPGSAAALAEEAVRDGFDLVVAAGGDGTVNEVLNGLGQAPDGFARARLGVIPIGSVNVFAREHRLPLRWPEAWEVIRAGRERRIDILESTHHTTGASVRRFFAQMAGAGPDARAVELIDWGVKKRHAYSAYILAGLRALRETPAPIMVECESFRGPAQLVLIGNGRFYGGPHPIFPQADPADGRLDLTVFPRMGLCTALGLLPRVLAGRPPSRRAARFFQAERVRLTGAERVPLQLDGERAGQLPADIRVCPQALRLITP